MDDKMVNNGAAIQEEVEPHDEEVRNTQSAESVLPVDESTEEAINPPTFEWHRNEHGTWTAFATFKTDDGETTIECQLIHYEVVDGGINFRGEVNFMGNTYVSDPHFVEVVPDQNSDPDEIGRGKTTPAGSYCPNPKAIENENDPLNDVSQAQLNNLLKQVGNMVKIMEQNWLSSRREFQLTDEHMKELYTFNQNNADEMPDGLSPEEQENWDRFNGLLKLTEEDVERIFGSEHPIIGVEHTVTIDRIRDVVGDYFSWHYAMHEYKKVHDAYVKLIEIEEEKNIQVLRDRAEAEEDPVKRQKMLDSIDLYYHRKYLGFLADELDDGTKKRLASAWNDSRKIEYWMKRTRDKLTRMKISNQVIYEIADFERRFMEEKYHRIYNILLLYFMNIVTYCKPDEKSDANRNMAVCMVFGLDSVIRNTATEEVREKIMNNVRGFLDQMLDYMKEDETQ